MGHRGALRVSIWAIWDMAFRDVGSPNCRPVFLLYPSIRAIFFSAINQTLNQSAGVQIYRFVLKCPSIAGNLVNCSVRHMELRTRRLD